MPLYVEYCDFQELGPSLIRGRAAVSDPTEEGPDPVGVPVYSAGAVITSSDDPTPHTYSTMYANAGTWTNTPTSYTYHWYLNGSSTGQTGQSLYLPDIGAVDGDVIRCVMRACNAIGCGAAHLSNTLTLIPTGGSAPVNVTPPVLTGGTGIGDTLTLGHAGWANVPTSYAHKWYRKSFRGSKIPLVPSGLQDWTQEQGFAGSTTFQTYGVRHIGLTVPIGTNPGNWHSDHIPLTGTGSAIYVTGELYQSSPTIGNAIITAQQFDAMDVLVSAGLLSTFNVTDTGYFTIVPEYLAVELDAVYVVLYLANAGGGSFTDIQEVRARNLVLHRGEAPGSPVEIIGETNQTYTVAMADEGWTIVGSVEATNAFGSSAYVDSNETVGSAGAAWGSPIAAWSFGGGDGRELLDVADDGSFVIFNNYDTGLMYDGSSHIRTYFGDYVNGITSDPLGGVMIEDYSTDSDVYFLDEAGSVNNGPIGEAFQAGDYYSGLLNRRGGDNWVISPFDGNMVNTVRAWKVGIMGENLDPITPPPGNDWEAAYPLERHGTVAPDGTWIVGNRSGYSSLYIWDDIGSAPIPLVTGGDIACVPGPFAPDSSGLVCILQDAGSDLRLAWIARDGTQTDLTSPGLSVGYDQLAFGSESDRFYWLDGTGSGEIKEVLVDGSGTTSVFVPAISVSSPLTVSDANTIAFLESDGSNWFPTLIDTDGNNYYVFALTSGTTTISFLISKDGNTVWWTEDDGGTVHDVYLATR